MSIIEEKDLGQVIKCNEDYSTNYSELDEFGCINFDVFTYPEGFIFKNHGKGKVAEDEAHLAKHSLRIRFNNSSNVLNLIKSLKEIHNKLAVYENKK